MDTNGLIRNTIAFLRLAAVELRRLAERAPEIAVELNDIADKLMREVAEYETRQGPPAPQPTD